MSELPFVRNTVNNQMTMELEAGAPPKWQAPLLPLTIRGFAFYKLLKIWTACRSDDLTSLNPGSLRMVHSGLLGTLERTKTSGPGKRVRFLQIFDSRKAVSRKAYLAPANWLTVGWEIWNRPAMCFERHYFLPRPRKDWAGVQRVMATYPETVVLSKSLWKSLRRPMVMELNWQLSHDFLLDTGDAVFFWTEHSERNLLVSVLTCLETPRDQRDFVGRVDVLPLVEAEAASGPPAPVQEGGDSLSDDPPFLVPNTVVGKNRLRRLHRRGGCGATPADLRDMIPLENLQGIECRVACKHYWRSGAQPEVAGGQCSASSGSTSSSTESGTDVSSNG
eukprot:s1379_g20.t2